jgi:hypothetical protein
MINKQDVLPIFSKVEVKIKLKCNETGITITQKEVCEIVGIDIKPDSNKKETLTYKLDVLSLKNRGYTGYTSSKFIYKDSSEVTAI